MKCSTAVECKNAICWISKYDFRLAGMNVGAMKERLTYLLWCSIIDRVPLDWWLFGDQSRVSFRGRLVICFRSEAGSFELDPVRLVVVHAKNRPLVLTGYHLEHVRDLGYDLEQTQQ